MSNESIPSRASLRRNFNRASATFDAAAVLHRELRERLLERLQIVRGQPAGDPQVIVDLGAGTGQLYQAIQQRFPKARVIAIDFAESMLRQTRSSRSWRHFFSDSRVDGVCADAYALPLRNASVDWIASNAMLQWCAQPDAVFAEVQRVLKPGGLFSFTTFGPDTLRELRSAWSTVDNAPRVLDFIDMHDLGDALLRAGLSDPVMDVEHLTLTYSTFAALASELKATGSAYSMAHSVARSVAKNPSLSGRSRIAALAVAYESFRRDGSLPASVEAVFGLAWQSATPREGRRSAQQSETFISLDTLRGELPHKRR